MYAGGARVLVGAVRVVIGGWLAMAATFGIGVSLSLLWYLVIPKSKVQLVQSLLATAGVQRMGT